MAANLDAMLNKAQGTGVTAFNAPGGSGSYDATTAAKTMLGDNYYNKAMKFMSPQELNDQIAKAQSYGRGIDLTQFKSNLDKFDAFKNMDGNILKYENDDGSFTNYGNVSDPMITANAPTTAQFFGDMAGGLSNLLGAAGEFVMGGGALGNIIDATKQKFSQGKDFVQNITNPGNINQRVANLTPEQRRAYMMYMNQGMPYQRAFELASGGQKFAMGGIANLN
jgi:hypothetical protein